MQCYIKLYVTFKRGHQEGNFKCIDIFNLTSRRLKKNTNLRQPRLSKKPVMVYRGRGRVGGFFHMVFRGGMEGDQSLQTEYTREQKKIDGELIIMLQSLGVEGGGKNKILWTPSPPPIQIVVINDGRSQGDNILDEEAITFSLLWWLQTEKLCSPIWVHNGYDCCTQGGGVC